MLDSDEVKAIHQASLAVLEKGGVAVHERGVLKLLSDAGAEVNFSTEIVRIPPHLIDDAVRKAPKSITLFGKNPKYDLELKKGKTYAHPSSGMGRIFDLETGKVRGGTLADLEKLTVVVDALPNINGCMQFLFPSDVPPEVKDIYATECILRNTEKHMISTPYTDANIRYIIELAAQYVGGFEELKKKPIIGFLIEPHSPLNYSSDTIKMLLSASKLKLPIKLEPAGMAGSVAPVTLAGTMVQNNAEFLAGLVILQLANPGCPVIYAIWSQAMDVRTGAILFGGIESAISSVSSIQMGDYYGLPTSTPGFPTTSKTHDEQAAFERTVNATLPMLAGVNYMGGVGTLDTDLTTSFEQMVIDDEFLGVLSRMVRGIEVNAETLAVDVICKVGPGGSYLGQEHTRRHYKQELYFPQMFDTGNRKTWEEKGSKDLARVARDKALKILHEHQPPHLDKDVTKNLGEILNRARKNLVT
jgi:trimethylamine--corrinoid protein Co-methyltransferase